MTKSQLAKNLNIDRKTLDNWEKNKPELIKLINLGLHSKQIILENDRVNKKLKKLLIKLDSSELQLPKDDIDRKDFLDYRNPSDFDEDRVNEICKFLSSVDVKDFKNAVINGLRDQNISSGTLEYIKKQGKKENIFKEFGKFIRTMETDNIDEYIVKNFNNILNFNFNEKDKEIYEHIETMYDYYNSIYKIEATWSYDAQIKYELARDTISSLSTILLRQSRVIEDKEKIQALKIRATELSREIQYFDGFDVELVKSIIETYSPLIREYHDMGTTEEEIAEIGLPDKFITEKVNYYTNEN